MVIPGTIVMHPKMGAIYKKPPRKRDDLKRISGIGPVLEQTLNEYGIYTYQQIMHWDDVAVEEISRLLVFRDRVKRDCWIEQAAELFHSVYDHAA